MPLAALEPVDEHADGLGLITLRAELAPQFEIAGHGNSPTSSFEK
jgi:hypothetical protein